MSVTVKFQPAWVAGASDGEEARLACANGCLVAVLLRVADPALPRDRRGWYLEAGFGPCHGEGVLFRSLRAAEAWVRGRLPPDWSAHCAVGKVPTGRRLRRAPVGSEASERPRARR